MHAFPSSERVMALAGDSACQVALEIVEQTGSTNADLLARAATLSQPVLRWALHQTAGRGRAGRQWTAERDAALTFSLAWKLHVPMHALSGLSLAIGMALVQCFADKGVVAQLKWPNDVLRDGAKLAGILIETVKDRREPDTVWAVIGIGINLAHAQHLSAQLGRAVADLGVAHADREAWVAWLLTALCDMLPCFEREGFAPFAQRWAAVDAYAGREVNIIDHGDILHAGRVAGVDVEGRLLLDTAAGRIAIVAGDVSLRMRED